MARKFEERLNAIRAAVDDPGQSGARKLLLETLRGKNGYLISVAAAGLDVSDSRVLSSFEDAFVRLLEQPIKRDPSCYGKLTLARALYDADVQAHDVYLRGSRHVQAEPVMGGTQDTAAELRGVCIMALVHQHHPRAMVEAARLLVDTERAARVAAARALGASGERLIAEPLLRLKIAAGEADPLVLGECFAALLELAPEDSLPYVATFVDARDDDVAESAILALGGSRLAGAFEILRERAEEFGGLGRRRILFLGIALLRTEPAWSYLVERIEDAAPPTASEAIDALATFAHDDALRDRVLAAARSRGEESIIAKAAASFATDS